MKLDNLEERFHVLDSHTSIWSVIRDVADSGVQEDAFYVCDIGDIVRKHKIWTTSMPRVRPFYAVKCNDSMAVLEVLAAMGTGFDCASKTEINKVLSLGVGTDRIVFANPAKPASHMRHAAAMGVDLMTFDNEVELHKVKKIFPHAKMVIRIRCDATVSQCPLGMKFGCDPITEAPKLLQVASLLGIEVVGVSFHVGSGCGEVDVYRRAIAAARGIFDFAASLGFDFRVLDIGGGFPGDFGTSIDQIADVVNAALEDFFPDPSVQVIAEPGRFYVSSAYTLACSVHSIRTVLLPHDPVTPDLPTKHFMYYINDGVYGSFNCILYDHQRVVPQPLKDCSRLKLHSTSIWGPTCDGLDQVVEDVMFPKLELGDWIVFENMGAYTLPVASPFNGFPIPKVHFVADESIWLLLKDMLPLTEAHFVFGNVSDDVRTRIKMDEDDWSLPNLPIKIPVCGDVSEIEEHVLDYVDACPSN